MGLCDVRRLFRGARVRDGRCPVISSVSSSRAPLAPRRAARGRRRVPARPRRPRSAHPPEHGCLARRAASLGRAVTARPRRGVRQPRARPAPAGPHPAAAGDDAAQPVAPRQAAGPDPARHARRPACALRARGHLARPRDRAARGGRTPGAHRSRLVRVHVAGAPLRAPPAARGPRVAGGAGRARRRPPQPRPLRPPGPSDGHRARRPHRRGVRRTARGRARTCGPGASRPSGWSRATGTTSSTSPA